jgi:opacity protein-like surface antigen
MKTIKPTIIALICLGFALLSGTPASAEWFGDVYVGATFTQSHDVRINAGAAGGGTFSDVDFKTGLTWGGRFGHYFESLPFLGVAVDLLNFSSDISRSDGAGAGSFDLSTTAVAVDLLLRLPLLKTADAPKGRLQPYVGAGVPVFFTTVTPRNTTLFRNHQPDTAVAVGYSATGGIAFQVFSNLMLFAEYRFNHHRVDADLENSVSASNATFRTDLDSHSTLIGVSARW